MLWKTLSCLAALSLAAVGLSDPLEGITFSNAPGKVFLPVREIEQSLGWYVDWVDDKGGTIRIDEKPIPKDQTRQLFDGTNLVDLGFLRTMPVEIEDHEDTTLSFRGNNKEMVVQVSRHEVEISLEHQQLIGYQGSRIVMRTNISTGRRGYSTPRGVWPAGHRVRHRVSRQYDNAPMPYSVHVTGGIFIHGSSSVPRRPASHGCIRMPLTGRNAASYFFYWVERGATITIASDWSEEVKALIGASGTDVQARR